MTNIQKSYQTSKAVNKTAKVSWKIFRALLLIGLSFIILYPLIYMVSMAFRPQDQIYDPSVIWVPKAFTLDNVKQALEMMNYKDAVLLTLRLNIVSSLLQLLVCAITGYSFARFEFRGKNIMFALAVFSILVPPQIISTPLFMQFKDFNFFGFGSIIGLFTGTPATVNLIDSPLTYYLTAIFGAGIKSGLFIFIFRQFFKGLPKELEDAAAIDGCGFFSTFVRIIIPNSLVVFVMAFLLSSVWYWNDYFTASMFMRNVETVSISLVRIANMSALDTLDPYKMLTVLQAGCLLSILPILILFLALQRFFIQGVERSGIVG